MGQECAVPPTTWKTHGGTALRLSHPTFRNSRTRPPTLAARRNPALEEFNDCNDCSAWAPDKAGRAGLEYRTKKTGVVDYS